MNSYVTLQGSEKSAPAAQKIETLNPDEIIGVTVKLARGKSFDEDIRAGRRYSRIDFASKYGVDDESVSAVQEFAARSHLSVENVGKAESEILRAHSTSIWRIISTRVVLSFAEGAGRLRFPNSFDI
jgi:hypothetical protein